MRRKLVSVLDRGEHERHLARIYSNGRKVGYSEALDDPFRIDPDAFLPAPDNSALFRKAGATESDKDYTALHRNKLRKLSIRAYHLKATAQHLVELASDFIIGEGLSLKPRGDDEKDEKFADWLNSYWSDEVNGLEIRHPEEITTLMVDGEFAKTIENIDIDGKITYGMIESFQIRDVIQDRARRDIGLLIENPKAPEQPLNFVVMNYLPKDVTVGIDPEDGKAVVRRPAPDGSEPVEIKIDGACFFAAVGRIAGARRGKPDLVPQIDLIDLQDEILYRVADRARMLAAAVYDVTVDGGDKAAIDLAISDMGLNRVPEALETIGHSDRVTVSVLAPKLGVDQISQLERIMRVIIYGTRGYPEAFSGSAEDSNRATLAEQGSVPARRLRRRQKAILNFYVLMIRHAIRTAIAASQLPAKAEGKEYEFDIVAPEIGTRDKAAQNAAIQSLSQALTALAGDKSITLELKNSVAVQALRDAGFTVDPSISGVDEKRIEEQKVEAEQMFAGTGGGSAKDEDKNASANFQRKVSAGNA